MSRHQLSLEIPDVANDTILKVLDSSTYASLLGVSCEQLEIAAPGNLGYVTLPVKRDFNKTVTAFDLGLQQTAIDNERYSLPDGVYQVRYSVAPNTKVYVEYYHLRLVQVMNSYYAAVARTLAGSCEPAVETDQVLRQLTTLKRFMEAAKYEVETNHRIGPGTDLLCYVKKRISKFL